MKKRVSISLIFNLTITVFLYLFFTKFSPLIMYDCDDWTYIGIFRIPLPIPGAWNPTRVFFESIMPVMGWLGAKLIFPITNDYVFSITVISAMLLTALIMVMCISFYRLMRNKYGKSEIVSLVMEVLFLTLFFLIFRTRSESNHMFCAADLCCVYNYTMPGILNAIAVLIMLQYENVADGFRKMKILEKVLFIILLYFALLSNIFHSVIIAAYCGASVLIAVITKTKNCRITEILSKKSFEFIALMLWFVVLLIEKTGNRSEAFTTFDILNSLIQFKAIVLALSKPFMIICVISFAHFIYRSIGQRALDMSVVSLFVATVATTLFLILLNSLVGYMSRVDATWGIWFYMILFCTIELGELLNSIKWKTILLPAVLIIIIVLCYYPDGSYMISSSRNRNYRLCYYTSSYFVDSIVEADRKGELEVEIPIPEVEVKDGKNLTFYPGFGNIVSETLYNHGIITKKMTVIEIIDPSLNGRFLEK